jgi:sugar phosphate permease
MVATGPGQTYTLSVIIDPLIEQFGLSRTAVSSAYALATIASALGLPLLGRLIDRCGQRAMILAIYLALGAVCFLFPLVAGPLTLFLGFTGLRLFGQGAGMMVSFNLPSQWFIRRRGTAMTVIMVGGALASATYPPLLHLSVAGMGWRTSFLLLGLSVWVLVLLPTVLLVADRPEELGLLPDGAPPAAGAAGDAARDDPSGADALEENWTLREAVGTVHFWLISLAMAVPGMLLTGMMFHQISFFQQQGIDAGTAAGIFTVFSLSMLAVTLVFGPLLDRWATRYMITVGLFLLPVTMWFMLLVDTPLLAVAYGILLGLSAGTYFSASNYVWPRYFGRRHLGSIQGVSNTIRVIGTALGPMPFGVAYDLLGGYHEAILAQSILPLVMGGSLLFLGTPVKAGAAAAA